MYSADASGWRGAWGDYIDGGSGEEFATAYRGAEGQAEAHEVLQLRDHGPFGEGLQETSEGSEPWKGQVCP